MPLKRNPFEFFGLTPKLVSELSDEILFKLIRSIYRTLQLAYHPDRGGDPKKALELNLAYESLNWERDPESFRRLKRAYIQRLSRKTLKKELEELSAQNRKLLYIQELLKERFWHYLLYGLNKKEEIFKQGLALKLSLLDVVSQLNLSQYSPLKRKRLFSSEIWLWKEGMMLKGKAETKTYFRLKNWIILGTIKREHFSPWPFLQRDFREEGMVLKDYLSRESFLKEALLFLSPELKVNHYLFTYTSSQPERVYLEGLITKVEDVSALEFLNRWKEGIEGEPLTKEKDQKNAPKDSGQELLKED